MCRPAPRPPTLVFPTRALPLKNHSRIASRSGDGAAAAYRGRPAMHGRLEITKRNPVAAKAYDLIMPSFSGLRPRAHVGVFACAGLARLGGVPGRDAVLCRVRRKSENAQLREHRLADGDALGGIGRSRHIDVQREGQNLAVLFHPPGPPTKIWSAGKAPSGLAVEDFAVAAFKPDDIARDRLRTDRRIELLLRQPCDEASFLDGADFKRSVEPERVDDRPRLPIAEV